MFHIPVAVSNPRVLSTFFVIKQINLKKQQIPLVLYSYPEISQIAKLLWHQHQYNTQ